MLTTAESELFVKTYSDTAYRFPTMVRHDGVLIAFAMDARRRIHYSVLDFSPTGSMSMLDADHWSANPQPLTFATELAGVGYGVADQASLPTVRLGSSRPVPAGQVVRPDEIDAFLSSTARFSAAAPFQVLSDGRYLYVIRQAIAAHTPDAVTAAQRVLLDPTASADTLQQAHDLLADADNIVYVTDASGQSVLDAHGQQIPMVNATLLVDRFVLVGTTLEPKLEVRYQRSRSRTRPAGSTDSLGAVDLDKKPFVEPTQDLRFVPAVSQGRFAAILVPTQVAEVFRWQLFTYDEAGAVIWSYSVARTDDGLFDTLGTQALTCTDHPDVYALTAGTCPRPSLADPTVVCGKTLVARVADDRHSGTALSFPTDGSGVVTLNGATGTGTEFTVEAWISPDPAATGERVLLSCAGDPNAAGPSMWVIDASKLRVGFGGGTTFYDVTTDAVLAAGEWNHVAVTYRDGRLQVYVDGVVQFASSAFGGAVPGPSPIAAIGAPAQGYAGLVDDVRVWSVALAAPDIEVGRHTALTGLEAGLVGYWRLDEGSGTATWDAASTAKGLLDGPTWVSSDAPISVPTGLSRSAIRLLGRTVTGGLGATLYFQQENAVAGYAAAQPAPLKQAARVMVALLSAAPPATASLVTTLDFGVGVDGMLADLPGEIDLVELDVPGGGQGTGADALAQVLEAQADVATLTRAVATDEATLVDAQNALVGVQQALGGQTPTVACPQHPDIVAAAWAYVSQQAVLASLPPLLPGMPPGFWLATEIQLLTAQIQALKAQLDGYAAALPAEIDAAMAARDTDRGLLSAAQTNLDSLQRLLNGDTTLGMPLLHVDGSGLTVSGAALGFAPGTQVPVLFDSALGRVSLYFRDAAGDFLLAYYDTFTGRATQHLGAEVGEVALVARAAAAELDALTAVVSAGSDDTTCTLVVTLPGTVEVTETWTSLPRDAASMAAVLNGTAAPVFLAPVHASSGKIDALALSQPLSVPVPSGALLQIGQEILTTTSAAARGATSLEIEPRIVSLAENASVFRLLYDYAAATSTRAGADLRHGSLLIGVDARGATGDVQLGTAQPLGSTPSCRWFAAPPGTTVDFNGTTTYAGVLSSTAVHLDGKSGIQLDPHPELDLTGLITLEAWVRPTALPQGFANIIARGFALQPEGEVYLRINNGQYQVGSWDGTDHFAGIALPAADVGNWVHLAGTYDGTAWNLYRNGLLLASSTDAVGAVPVAANWAVGATASANDRFFTGDIDEIKVWDRPLGPQEITDGMNRRLTGSEAGLAAYLYMERGVLVDHDASPVPTKAVGSPTQVTSPPVLAHLSGFDVTGDVSLETWLNPSGAGLNRVLVHHSDASSYGMAVRQRDTALHFDGVGGHAGVLPDVPALSLTGQITLEAWVRPGATDGLRDIVAHGYTLNPPGEVYLRVAHGSYQAGNYTNNAAVDAAVSAPVPTQDATTWVHIAGVFDGTAWRLYRNGILMASTPSATGAVPVTGGWTIGNSLAGDRPFLGDIDEVRIWSVGRSASDILAGMTAPVAGTETGLVGAWRYDGQILRDATPARHDGRVQGALSSVPGPHPAYSAIVTVGNQGAETSSWIGGGEWSHVAASFEQFYGVQLAAGAYADAGAGMSLNLSRDLTIEVGVRLDDLSSPQGLLTRGVLDDGTDDTVPYALWATRDGALVFAFEDKAHGVHQFVSGPGVLTAGVFRRIAVTRRHNVEVDTTNAGQKGGSAVVSSWDDVAFYADGAPVGPVQRYDGPDVGSSSGTTLIGRAYGPGSTVMTLRGALSEVRLWSTAREGALIGAPITGSEVGLVSWWRMQDGAGSVVTDSKGRQHAALHGAASWVHTPDGRGSALTVYLDGVPVSTTPLDPASLTAADRQFTLGALGNPVPGELFKGQLDELRVWRVARTGAEIQDSLFSRLTGGFADLVASYSFGAGAVVADNSPRGNDLLVSGGGWVLSTAPIGEDTPLARNALLGLRTRFNGTVASPPAAAEYASLETDAMGVATGVLKRAYSYVDESGGWRLVTGFKVGDLTTQWVGQAQFDPQLIGYIEGAPPVPSENLTVQDSYSGASSVALTEATTTAYTYASTRDSGFNASFELSAGEGAAEQSFVGLLELEAPLGIGVGEIELTSAADVGVTFTGKANFETSLSWLNDTSSGQGSTRSRVSSLGLTGNKETKAAHEAIGTRFVPNNSGFALVQSQTADVYALRLAHTGTLVAYQMRPNPDIPKDWNVITFPIDPRYTKQGVLDGKVGGDVDVDYPNAGTYSPDLSYFKPIEAYGLKTRIEQQEQELSTLFAQHGVDPNMLSGGQLPDMPLPIKRDLVNNYVWTADGGQFAETVSTLDTYSESVGGAYHFQGMAGGTLSADISIFGVAINFEVSAMFGGHLDLSVTKTLDSQKSFEVDVVAGGEQDITVVDGAGKNVRAPGKVDAYRWLTFYLAPRSDNHDAFFNQVVDPIWLDQSSDPAAVALRQARQDAKRPAAWRVLHRVTYVSRVLAPVGSTQQPVEQALAALNISSNYELIRTLEPFVRGRTGTYAEFAGAVRQAVVTYLPDLTPHLADILGFLVLYYGIDDAPQLAAAASVA